MQATLHFHSFAAARAFRSSNRFDSSEIVAEGDGFLTLNSSVSQAAVWENNAHVFSVTWA